MFPGGKKNNSDWGLHLPDLNSNFAKGPSQNDVTRIEGAKVIY